MKNKIILFISLAIIACFVIFVFVLPNSSEEFDEYTNSEDIPLSLYEGTTTTSAIDKYLSDNNIDTGIIKSKVVGPILLDGEEEYYTDEVMYILDKFPGSEGKTYYMYYDQATGINYYLIEIDGNIVKFEYNL